MDDDQVSDLIGRIYDAALDPAIWPEVFSSLSRLTGESFLVARLHKGGAGGGADGGADGGAHFLHLEKHDPRLDIDGARMQQGSTATMIFGVAELVSYLSRFMILEPGGVISTGTPPGVGLGMKPQRFLAPGEVVSLGIAGLGERRHEVAAG